MPPRAMPESTTPPRFEQPSALRLLLYLLVVLTVVSSLEGAELSLSKFVAGVPRFVDMVARMLPPDGARIEAILARLLETFQMAVAGTIIGVVLSLPLAVLSTWRHTPHAIVYHATRALVALFRTVPDLVWALLFVIAVGLGPFAGTLALVADTIGFCGRFFAEAMEEAEEGPQEALTALGASRLGVVASAVIPAALPSMINSSLFALERAVRSSVVLGLVGAGGIGIELKVAFDMFQYDLAGTIILAIFALVLAVERLSAWARRRII
jgi:phosphonate transport system permease protein